MVDSMNICKSLNINIGTVMKNPEILKFVLDHLKTKQFVSMQTKIHLIYQDMFLINIRHNKCVIKLF